MKTSFLRKAFSVLIILTISYVIIQPMVLFLRTAFTDKYATWRVSANAVQAVNWGHIDGSINNTAVAIGDGVQTMNTKVVGIFHPVNLRIQAALASNEAGVTCREVPIEDRQNLAVGVPNFKLPSPTPSQICF